MGVFKKVKIIFFMLLINPDPLLFNYFDIYFFWTSIYQNKFKLTWIELRGSLQNLIVGLLDFGGVYKPQTLMLSS